MNSILHFGELHSNNAINDKIDLFENYIPQCYKVKRILISFNCFSEYIMKGLTHLIANAYIFYQANVSHLASTKP